MWTVEWACMMGMQKSDIYSEFSERNRHCVGAGAGSLVRCSARATDMCVLCVSNSRQLAYPGLSYRGPIRYRHQCPRYRGTGRPSVADGLRTAGRRSRRRAHVRDKKMPKHERPPTRVGCDSLDLDFHLGVPPVRFFTARSLASRSVRSRSTTTDTARKSITRSRECWAAHWAATAGPRNSA